MQLHAGKFRFTLDSALIMGIINVTPDSFSDGGRFLAVESAVEHGLKLREEGADLLDVGGESTRPGADAVSMEEELHRVIPVVRALATEGAAVSIDTQKPEVMRAAIDAGAVMVNDVNALRAKGALAAVAATDAAVCLMHMQGSPKTMQQDPRYGDVVAEVRQFLLERADAAVAAGIGGERIVLDPGFGFGKTRAHNIELLRHLDSLANTGYAVLAGLSRKSLIAHITGRSMEERVFGSVVAAIIAVQKGARLVRVHDVAATKDALAVLGALRE
jgi:dihydropteroate synthase